MPENELKNLVEFFHIAGKLKLEKRRGWIVKKVREPESVADHSFRLALLAMVFAERQGLDACRAVKMALVHDLPEAICGDVAVRVSEELQEMPNKEKEEMEQKAFEQEVKLLPEEIAKEFKELFDEFNKRESKEARLVYELDRLEALFQATEYEKEGNFEVSLQEFFDYASSRLKNWELKNVFGLLMKERGKN